MPASDTHVESLNQSPAGARVTIVLVNWNSGSQLAEAIQSIIDFGNGLVELVVIVDNASTDGSLKAVEESKSLPFKLEILRNTQNIGFGAACNRGAQLGTSEFVLFLNPDARLLQGSIEKPLVFMARNDSKRVGVLGVQLVDRNGNIARSCARFPTLKHFVAHSVGLTRLRRFASLNIHMIDWPHDQTTEVDHVIGAFYLIRRSLFESLGGFDEQFFVYLEDLDLSLRVKKAGYSTVYLVGAQAFHAGGGTTERIKARRLFYSLQSKVLYGAKHLPAIEAVTLSVMTLAVEPFIRTVAAIAQRDLSGVRNTWHAEAMLLLALFQGLSAKPRE